MTIKEIAELAGTSRGTVDRVLNGRGNVSLDLEKRIRAIAEETNYYPNQLARALINSRKRMKLGVVICSVNNPFFDEVIRGLNYRAKKLASYGVEIVLREIKGFHAKEQIEAVESLLEQGIEGLDIMPINEQLVTDYLTRLTIPIVTFNNDIHIPRLAFVGCNYYNSGRLSGDLAQLILSNGGVASVIIGSSSVIGHRERVRGFSDSIAECSEIILGKEYENQDDEKISYQTVKKMIANDSPDLIYFGAGGIAGGIQAIMESEKKISILTVDYTETVEQYLKNGIIAATVTQEPFNQGALSIKILYDYIANEKMPKTDQIYTENRIILKSSVCE